MSKEEAKSILDSEIGRIRNMSYEEFLHTVGAEPYKADQVGPSGEQYKVTIKTKMKNRKKGLVRIVASVRETMPKKVIRKIPILGIPITSHTMRGMFIRFTIGPDDFN